MLKRACDGARPRGARALSSRWGRGCAPASRVDAHRFLDEQTGGDAPRDSRVAKPILSRRTGARGRRRLGATTDGSATDPSGAGREGGTGKAADSPMSSPDGPKPARTVASAAQTAWPRRLGLAQGPRVLLARSTASGFTLLEILAALAIAAAIIVGTTALLHDVVLNFDRGTRRVSEAERLLQAVDRLATDFASARFVLPSNPTGIPGSQGAVLFTGDAANVTFVAAGGVAVGPQGEEMVKLSVETDGEVSRLVRRRAAWLEPHRQFPDLAPQDPVVLLEGKVDISFAYGRTTPEGELTWSDSWTGGSGLPRLVRVIVREPISGVDLLAEAPFLVRTDAPAACARAQQPTSNGRPAGPDSAAGTNAARHADPAAVNAQQIGLGCLSIGSTAPAAPADPRRVSR